MMTDRERDAARARLVGRLEEFGHLQSGRLADVVGNLVALMGPGDGDTTLIKLCQMAGGALDALAFYCMQHPEGSQGRIMGRN